MKQEEMRQKLIEGTISVIAREGMDGASTKRIRLATAINEAYIYRCFKDKEDLFAKSFSALDEELVARTLQYVEVMYAEDIDFELRCRYFFFALWSFFLGEREKCLAYVQYFYSPYFVKCSAEEHQKRFAPLVEKMRAAFIEEADVWMLLNHILNVMLDFAVKVHNDQMPNEDNYAEHVFRVIYMAVRQYFKGYEGSELRQ